MHLHANDDPSHCDALSRNPLADPAFIPSNVGRVGKLPGDRLPGIDAFRYFSFIAIVILHSITLPDAKLSTTSLIINESTRFAVPFFFLTSGYFLSARVGPAQLEIRRLIGRLLPVMLFWTLIYIVSKRAFGVFLHVRSIIYTLLTGGPAFHLWFLPALGLAATLAILTRKINIRIVWLIAVGLYLLGLICGPYNFLFGLHLAAKFDTRNGPFFGFLFLFAGVRLRKAQASPNLLLALALITTGFCLQLAECFVIAHAAHLPITYHDCLLGTIPFGIGVFQLAQYLNRASWPRVFAAIGQMALGMYCIHLLWLWAAAHFIRHVRISDTVAIIVITVTMSTFSVMALSQVPMLRRYLR
jgi:surface polysaccharide O-acyltransferase-like enzyme